MIITTAERPNAWVGPFESLASHISRFFRDLRGEIWAFDTTLDVLSDATKFGRFYLLTIASLSTRIQSVKLILAMPAYDTLRDSVVLDKVRSNLREYPAGAPPIWVANIADVTAEHPPPTGIGGNQWVLCVDGGHFVHDNALAIRLVSEPFREKTAITWPFADKRIMWDKAREFFEIAFTTPDWFHKFEHGPTMPMGNTDPFELSAQWRPPVLAPVVRKRVLVIVALHTELRVLQQVFRTTPVAGLEDHEHTEITAQGKNGKQIAYSVVVRVLRQMGNSHAAVRTVEGLNAVDPDIVVLTGIAGGIELAPPTIVVGTMVHAFEYATVEAHPTWRWVYSRESRTIESQEDFGVAITKTMEVWAKRNKRIMKRCSGEWLKCSDVKVYSQELIASGSKKSKCSAFNREIEQRDKKIVAIEMEGEGVGLGANCGGKPFLIIKGVSDRADETTSDDNAISDDREAAAKAAAWFLRVMLEGGFL